MQKGFAALWLLGKRPELFLVLGAVALLSRPSAGQLSPPSTGGIVELDWLLQRLTESRRVLMIGAHPDDEDAGLITLLARGYGADVAYLSLSRGEGGQNLIGQELGPELGLLRSMELESARRIDGARQFFTRGFDFGYTRSLEETGQLWPLDTLAKDAVRIVRRFRPHVLVSVFSGTTRDGHGQHQAAGVTARRVFDLAGDANAFPELGTEEGLQPWTPLKFFIASRFDTTDANVRLAAGGLDQRVGRSYFQIAMESRSQHRSQDMGGTQPLGPRQASLRLLEDRTGSGSGVFSGIPLDRPELRSLADSLRSEIRPAEPSRITEGLVRALPLTSRLERELVWRAVANSAGLVIDAVASDDEVVPGQQVEVEISLYNAGPFAVELTGTRLRTPGGWRIENERGDDAERVPPGSLVTRTYRVGVPQSATPTQPYFLRQPLDGALYDWKEAPPEARGLPFDGPELAAAVTVRLMNSEIVLRREVTYRFGDQASGEVRKPVVVRPRVGIQLTPSQVVWPAGGADSRSFTATLTHFGNGPYRGEVALRAEGWPDVPTRSFSFLGPGETSFAFEVAKPVGVTRSTVMLAAVATGEDGLTYASGVKRVEYPHVTGVAWTEPAMTSIELAPIALPPVNAIGYVRGAADRVPEALAGFGLPIELLSEADLASGDLSRFDVIVVGSRAYEIDSALARHNDRLLQFVSDGGHLVVQYQQYTYVRGGFAPYRLDIGRPHDRVTDENAPVRLLRPDDPVFHRPNTIVAADWEHWPQERGLYFAGSWDNSYTPLVEMTDPGREPVQGGLLTARYGSGTYVYTGISFFRSLPAGVVGAFKLFFNILAVRPTEVP